MLLLPMAGLAFLALGVALGGDVFRLGFRLVNLDAGLVLPVSFLGDVGSDGVMKAMEGTEEDGVSPFQARLLLFLTLVLLLLASLMLSCSRFSLSQSASPQTISQRTLLGSSAPPYDPIALGRLDHWAGAFGPDIAFEARKLRIQALKEYLVHLDSSPLPLTHVDPHSPHAPRLEASESQPLLPPRNSPAMNSVPPFLATSLHLPPPLNLLLFLFSTYPAFCFVVFVPGRLVGMNKLEQWNAAERWKKRHAVGMWRSIAAGVAVVLLIL
jgi:hypothetical protein